MQNPVKKYDLFLSYAHVDYDWVYSNLFIPLSHCVKKSDGRAPVIFFDRDGKTGIKSGANFVTMIATALSQSENYVFAISEIYPSRPNCQYEYTYALTYDVTGEEGRLHPLLIDDKAKLPIEMKIFHYNETKDPLWFAKLCDALNLETVCGTRKLVFLTSPQRTFVDNTLAVVKVGLQNAEGQKIAIEGEICLTSENNVLGGTLNAKMIDGIAMFDDLSFVKAGTHTIKAYSSMADDVLSAPYEIIDSAPAIPMSVVKWGGNAQQVVFFETGNAALSIMADAVQVLHLSGVKETPVSEGFDAWKIKELVKHEADIALLTWDGQALWFKDDGRSLRYSACQGERGGLIAASGWFEGAELMIGLWCGDVICLSFTGESRKSLHTKTGIFSIARFGALVVMADMGKKLQLYKQGQYLDTAEISERLLLMKECADHVIAIGENKLYYIEKSPFQVTDISVCLKEPLEACLAENGRIAVISGSGLGVLYDEQLNIVSRFRLPAGSRITFISKQGYVGFAAPQGSNYIVATRNLPSGRVVYSHKNGAFVISPSGTAAILAGDNELSVIEGGTLYELLTRGEC